MMQIPVTRDIKPVLVQYWASVNDGGSTLNQQWLNVSGFAGIYIQVYYNVGGPAKTIH